MTVIHGIVIYIWVKYRKTRFSQFILVTHSNTVPITINNALLNSRQQSKIDMSKKRRRNSLRTNPVPFLHFNIRKPIRTIALGRNILVSTLIIGGHGGANGGEICLNSKGMRENPQSGCRGRKEKEMRANYLTRSNRSYEPEGVICCHGNNYQSGIHGGGGEKRATLPIIKGFAVLWMERARVVFLMVLGF